MEMGYVIYDKNTNKWLCVSRCLGEYLVNFSDSITDKCVYSTEELAKIFLNIAKNEDIDVSQMVVNPYDT